MATDFALLAREFVLQQKASRMELESEKKAIIELLQSWGFEGTYFEYCEWRMKKDDIEDGQLADEFEDIRIKILRRDHPDYPYFRN